MDEHRVLISELYGWAPVQARGWIDDKAFYFRSRHNRWSFRVATSPHDDPLDISFSNEGFYLEGIYDVNGSESASWMPLHEAERLIWQCAQRYMGEPYAHFDLSSQS